jgi:hypothetical protein
MPYTEPLISSALFCAIIPGDGTIHDERKGWGTISPDGQTVTWNDWQPPTQEEIDARRARIEWLKTPEGIKYCQETEEMIDAFFVRNGTSRAKIAAGLAKIINDAPPFRFGG